MIKNEDKVKTFPRIAEELGFTPRTLRNKIKKKEALDGKIDSGVQCLKAQKLIYDEFGYPPEVCKADYENV